MLFLKKDPDAKDFAEITINTVPDDAEIIIDGISEGNGSVVKEMLSEKGYSILVKKQGFQKQFFNIVNPDADKTYDVKLLPSLERRIKVSNAALTGYTVFSDKQDNCCRYIW